MSFVVGVLTVLTVLPSSSSSSTSSRALLSFNRKRVQRRTRVAAESEAQRNSVLSGAVIDKNLFDALTPEQQYAKFLADTAALKRET